MVLASRVRKIIRWCFISRNWNAKRYMYLCFLVLLVQWRLHKWFGLAQDVGLSDSIPPKHAGFERKLRINVKSLHFFCWCLRLIFFKEAIDEGTHATSEKNISFFGCAWAENGVHRLDNLALRKWSLNFYQNTKVFFLLEKAFHESTFEFTNSTRNLSPLTHAKKISVNPKLWKWVRKQDIFVWPKTNESHERNFLIWWDVRQKKYRWVTLYPNTFNPKLR